MDDKDPTSVIKMIKDLRSGSEAYRRNSGVSVRLSGTSYNPPMFNNSDACGVSPKRQKLDDTAASNSISNKSENDPVPGSSWEWRRLKGEVITSRICHIICQLHIG